MSDRSYGQVIIYDCPPQRRKALLALLTEEFALSCELEDGSNELHLFESYGADEQPLDIYETLSQRIVEIVPEAAFRCWGDPKYEYDGAICLHTPELGFYFGQCNSLGGPYLLSSEINDAVSAGDLEKVAGIPWLLRLDELQGVR